MDEELMNRERFFALLGDMPERELQDVRNMYWLAKNAHRLQVRDDGVRYFEHVRGVAVILIERGFRSSGIVIRALGHDLVEDPYLELPIIKKLFGQDVLASLRVLSKVEPEFDRTGKLVARHKKPLEQYFAALRAAGFEDRLAKCGDRLHNLRSMQRAWEARRQFRYAVDTRDNVLPIAERTDPWFASEIRSIIEPILARAA